MFPSTVLLLVGFFILFLCAVRLVSPFHTQTRTHQTAHHPVLPPLSTAPVGRVPSSLAPSTSSEASTQNVPPSYRGKDPDPSHDHLVNCSCFAHHNHLPVCLFSS